MGKFLIGTIFGLVLSVAYVWYDAKLPDWLELPDTLQRSLKAAAADDTLFDLDAPLEMRRRALEIYLANQASRAATIDADLGHPILSELVRRRVRRQAQIKRGLWSAYDQALGKPALRETLVTKYGDVDDETLKQRMLLAAVREEPFLHSWILRYRSAPTEKNVRALLVEISQLEPLRRIE